MEHEILVVAPQQRIAEVKVVQPPADAQLQRNVELATPTAEQAREADRVFAQQEKESQQVAGLMGVWTSVLLGHDLLVDHLNRPEKEKDEDRHQPALPER
jgi:hypothetical protein